ncbi:MAG: outer membrane protein OmpA-like peptidoglycan-associated protein [Myxococcota bacterium]|jgi:outer membrane protein OmpA-like peptidoglycan-associated protein
MMALLLTLAVAVAQTAPPTADSSKDVDIQLFRPVAASERTLWTDDTQLAPTGTGSSRFVLHYAHEPLVWVGDDGSRTALVSGLFALDASATYTWKRLRAELTVPVLLRGTSEISAGASGIGDLGFGVRYTVQEGATDALGLAFAGGLRVPTASVPGTGGAGPTWVARVISDTDFGDLRLSGSVGVALAPEVNLGLQQLGQAATLRAAGAWAPTADSGVAVEFAGQTALQEMRLWSSVPVEVLASAWHGVGERSVVRGGVGAGLSRGIGSPLYRLVLTIERVAADPDRDGDGIVAPDDRCPRVAETFNGVRDEDGCPEDARVLAQESGGEPNKDGDTAALATALELVPWLDPDGDGVPSHLDDCPNQPEDPDGFQDADGCPDEDDDEDGILDVNDACPRAAETFNDFNDEDGCPETAPKALEGLTGIVRGIIFETDSAALRPSSRPVLERVLAALEQHPAVTMLVEGHTDDQGGSDYNLDLATRRAAAVKRWLVDHGVQPDRLETVGFGHSRPIATNATPEGRAENRRVELIFRQPQESAP